VVSASGSGYDNGMKTDMNSENEAFRMRMFEQVCHIEAYRKEKQSREGRKLSREEAAAEWISSYAAGFPEALSLAA